MIQKLSAQGLNLRKNLVKWMIYTRPWLRDVWLQLIAAIAVWWNPSRLFGEIHPDYLVKSPPRQNGMQTYGFQVTIWSIANAINGSIDDQEDDVDFWNYVPDGSDPSPHFYLGRKEGEEKTHFYDDLHLAVSRFPSLTKMIMKMISKK